MRKLMLVLSGFFLLFACAGAKKMASGPMVVEETSKNTFVKGIQQPDGKHAGVTYSVIYTANAEIKIEAFFIKESAYAFETFTYEGKMYVTTTLYEGHNEPLSAVLPISYEGEALVLYSVKGKQYYYVVPQFDKETRVEAR
jgi:hypothetical protein